MTKRKTMNLEKLMQEVSSGTKRYVRFEEAAELYSVGRNTVRDWAKDAGAIRKVRGIALVNIQKMDEFIESFEERSF